MQVGFDLCGFRRARRTLAEFDLGAVHAVLHLAQRLAAWHMSFFTQGGVHVLSSAVAALSVKGPGVTEAVFFVNLCLNQGKGHYTMVTIHRT